jgi:hypothetical protein
VLMLEEEIKSMVDVLNVGVTHCDELQELVDWVLDAHARLSRQQNPSNRELEQFTRMDKKTEGSMIDFQTYLQSVWPCFGLIWEALATTIDMGMYNYAEVLSDKMVENRFIGLSESIKDVFVGLKQIANNAKAALKD